MKTILFFQRMAFVSGMVLAGCLEVEFAFCVHLYQDFVCSKNVYKPRFHPQDSQLENYQTHIVKTLLWMLKI